LTKENLILAAKDRLAQLELDLAFRFGQFHKYSGEAQLAQNEIDKLAQTIEDNEILLDALEKGDAVR